MGNRTKAWIPVKKIRPESRVNLSSSVREFQNSTKTHLPRIASQENPGSQLYDSVLSMRGAGSPGLKPSESLSIPNAVETLEVRLIETALERTGGNKLGAARLLGITRQGLHKKLKRYG